MHLRLLTPNEYLTKATFHNKWRIDLLLYALLRVLQSDITLSLELISLFLPPLLMAFSLTPTDEVI